MFQLTQSAPISRLFATLLNSILGMSLELEHIRPSTSNQKHLHFFFFLKNINHHSRIIVNCAFGTKKYVDLMLVHHNYSICLVISKEFLVFLWKYRGARVLMGNIFIRETAKQISELHRQPTSPRL